MDRGINRFLTEPHEEVAYHLGMRLTGFTVKVKPESYLLVVKGERRLDGHVVAFIEGKTLMDCFEYLVKHMTATNAPLKWRVDRYAG